MEKVHDPDRAAGVEVKSDLSHEVPSYAIVDVAKEFGRGAESRMISSWKVAKRLVILVVGSTVLLCGVVMIVLPGPAIVVIPAGLIILGSEFAWARRLLRRVRELDPTQSSGRGRRDAASEAASDPPFSDSSRPPPHP